MTIEQITSVEICEDDSEIKKLLVQHSRSVYVEPRENLPTPFRYHVSWSDAQHFFSVTRYYGFLMPEDNGYRAIRFPKSLFNPREAAEVIHAFIEDGMDQSGPCFMQDATIQDEVN